MYTRVYIYIYMHIHIHVHMYTDASHSKTQGQHRQLGRTAHPSSQPSELLLPSLQL